ncbi:MAG: hypothetical protein ACYDHZ_11025 [Dehalococcoidia bacterium]
MIGTVKCFSIVVILLVIFSFVLTSCQQHTDAVSENTIKHTVFDPLDNETISKIAQVPKPYPGLNSAVSQLVSAYESGGNIAATTFAKNHGIDLVDGTVRVTIEVKPRGKAAVVDAVNSAGGKVEIADEDNVQALVPLKQIKSLAGNPAINIIRIPYTLYPNSK